MSAERGLRCSFCKKHVTEVTYIMKLSATHAMCDLCIDNLVDMLREGA
jgi:hypothetical protein